MIQNLVGGTKKAWLHKYKIDHETCTSFLLEFSEQLVDSGNDGFKLGIFEISLVAFGRLLLKVVFSSSLLMGHCFLCSSNSLLGIGSSQISHNVIFLAQ